MSIRIAKEKDIAALVDFNYALASETEDTHLDKETLSQGVKAVFDNTERGFYVVSENTDGSIVGGLMVTYEWSDWRNAWYWWIVSVYVLPAARGKNVYRKLYEFVKQKAREEGIVCGFKLYVDVDNLRAQEVYKKVGMQRSRYLLFEEDV